VYGHLEPAFDISALSATAGAAFVARTTVYHVNQMDRLILKATTRTGFSVVEILSPCPTNFGRQNRLGSQVDMMKDLKKRSVRGDRWEKMTEAERTGRFPIGVLVEREMPRYLESYGRVCATAARLRGEGKV
jgi:2-oxoglutarate ferredoxin oxidoreductase subunit beta